MADETTLDADHDSCRAWTQPNMINVSMQFDEDILRDRPSLYLKNSSGGLAVDPYDASTGPSDYGKGGCCYVYDHRQTRMRELWIQNALNYTKTGLVDGVFADDGDISVFNAMNGWGVDNATATAYVKGQRAMLVQLAEVLGNGIVIADTRQFNPAALGVSAFAHMMQQFYGADQTTLALASSLYHPHWTCRSVAVFSFADRGPYLFVDCRQQRFDNGAAGGRCKSDHHRGAHRDSVREKHGLARRISVWSWPKFLLDGAMQVWQWQ
eukprot:SAG22_NODE_721_length_7648_cov_9.418466_6_plen_267_part_00